MWNLTPLLRNAQHPRTGPGHRLPTLILWLALCSLVISPLSQALGAPALQTNELEEQAQQILDQLTPEERVGQLFLVTFEGQNAGADSTIHELISRYHVSGVMLVGENNNFSDQQPLPDQILALSRQMQQASWASSQQPQTMPDGTEFTPTFIPLFIGMKPGEDEFPSNLSQPGLTRIPNQMALGATWNPDLVEKVGEIQGRELSSLGVNLLLGPSLDVLEPPYPNNGSDLGTRTFGGDPFWVGEMGRTFTKGLHTGSGGQIAVVGKHFPGHGGSDRLPEEEVATVRKSLEQLKNFELVPFFAVTGNAPSPEETVDALLTSHIRYQGFQGNIRATTRPVSFDPQALNLLMELPSIKAWRAGGGVMVSDDLGSLAVRRFYELTNQDFDMARRVALNAFLAGNDLLYIDDFSYGELDSFTAASRTLDFFAQKYREDNVFAQGVDRSVLRVLTLKLRIYGSFSLGRILPSEEAAGSMVLSNNIVSEVARQAATLISPSPIELDDTAPDPPNLNDRIVFLTDTRNAQNCSACSQTPVLELRSLEQVVLRLYGPLAGAQISPGNLSSYSLEELQHMMDVWEEDDPLERDLRRAHWIVFSMLDASQDVPSYQTLARFLTERPELFLQKRVVVFAFNAPYYLDATNISKLTAYYGLYSKNPQFVDIAAYLLFRELRPNGALPVSVPGVYDLNAALFPDPNQIIQLRLDYSEPETGPEVTQTPRPTQEFRIGDVIPLRTSVILDHNGHPVPDGTQVEFLFRIAGGESGGPREISEYAETIDGVARTTFPISAPGSVEVRVRTETALESEVLRFDIPTDAGVIITTATLEPTPTEPPTPMPTPLPPSPTALPEVTPEPPVESNPLGLGDWIMAMVIAALTGWASYRLAILLGQVRWGIRGGFLALIGGLLAYSYLALQLPGSSRVLDGSVSRGVFLSTLFGSLFGLALAWTWRALQSGRLAENRRGTNGTTTR